MNVSVLIILQQKQTIMIILLIRYIHELDLKDLEQFNLLKSSRCLQLAKLNNDKVKEIKKRLTYP